MINSYVALDLEMTGLNPATDKIIEIGAVKVIDGEITESYSKLINPQIPIGERVEALTGIHDSMVKGQPLIEHVIGELITFTEDFPLLGHNIIFDYSFLKKAAVNNRLKFEKFGIDTLKIARRVLPELEHKKLENLCGYFKIEVDKSHRALDDAISAMKVYEELYKVCPQDKGFIESVKLNYSVKRDTPITPKQVTYLTALLSQHKIEMEAEIKSLTKSQASRMIDKILSTYGH